MLRVLGAGATVVLAAAAMVGVFWAFSVVPIFLIIAILIASAFNVGQRSPERGVGAARRRMQARMETVAR